MAPNALQNHRDYGGADDSQSHSVWCSPTRTLSWPKRAATRAHPMYAIPFSQQRCPSRVGSWKSGNAQKLVTSSWRNFNTIPCPARRNPEPDYA
ncbi:hypothetical protein BD309DRAFT_968001 [Dichomitus squalens]|nr:hypothetical protein BD309DRAFT_968001 [Dichomitus squalens]